MNSTAVKSSLLAVVVTDNLPIIHNCRAVKATSSDVSGQKQLSDVARSAH
jgi:hypothetical protein